MVADGAGIGLFLAEMEFLFFLFRGEDNLEGDWERIDDRFAGCVVRVEKSGSGLAGRIVGLPAAMADAGWDIGDIKWRDIEPAGPGRWTVKDVRKHYNTRSRSVVGIDSGEYLLSVAPGGRLRLHTDPVPIFPAQRWRRTRSSEVPS